MRKQILRFLAPLVLLVLLSGCAGLSRNAKPEMAKDFTIALLDGGQASLSDYRGKPLVMIFGASWCPHCEHEMPIVKDACEKKRGGVQMLPIFVRSKRTEVEALVKKASMACKIGWDPEGEVATLYGVKGLPVTYFINAKGEIMDYYFGSIERSDLNEKIDELLKAK